MSLQIFSKVEAVLNNDWIQRSGEDVVEILRQIEMLSDDNVEIQFKNGAYVICGSFDVIALVQNFFSNQDRANQEQNNPEGGTPSLLELPSHSSDSAFELVLDSEISRARNVSSSNCPKCSCNALADCLCCQMPVKINETEVSEIESFKFCKPLDKELGICSKHDTTDHEIVKEVDPDIWDFINNKRVNDLEKFTSIHGISCFSEWDPEEELYKVHLKISESANDGRFSLKNRIEEAGESFSKFFQDMSDKCSIEEVRGKFSADDVTVQSVKTKFPDVYLKINSDGIFFIGFRGEPHKAKKQFSRIIAMTKKTAQL